MLLNKKRGLGAPLLERFKLAECTSHYSECLERFQRADLRPQPSRGGGRSDVRHHVALSIVGTDRTPDNGYFRAKVAQEKLIEAFGIPYTIIRATQFLEFLGTIAATSAEGNMIRLSPGLFQPIAADDVAAIVADVALAAPRSGIVEIAGPERAPFNEINARYLKAVGDPREVVSDPEPRYFFDEWLRRSQAGALIRNSQPKDRAP